MNTTAQIKLLKYQLPKRVKLVAVSKFHPATAIMEAYNTGQRIFGESRVQELCTKYKELPTDIEWHFIGSLQRNKVKDIAPFIHTIHSVDSLQLLQEIDKQACKQNRVIRVLLEIHVAEEDSKHGFTPDEVKLLIDEINTEAFHNLRISGLMGMATFTNDREQIRREFHTLSDLFKEIRQEYFSLSDDFIELSMGMTNDYEMAVEEGSTMVRIGSLIFGRRVLS
jgi:pyridoxal phosphate enzyme (YggS family)